MKVNEIINEGPWSDLVRQGRAAQKGMLSKAAGTVAGDFKTAFNAIPAVSKLKAAARTQIERANLEQATKMTQEWQAHVSKKPELAANLDVYRRGFLAWLSDRLKEKINAEGVMTQIQTKNPAAVTRYLAQFILPDLYDQDRPEPTPIPPKEPGDGPSTSAGGILLP